MPPVLRLAFAIALWSSLLAAPAAAQWTSVGGGPSHNGAASPLVSARTATLAFVGWPYETGAAIESSPVISRGNVVYIGSDDRRVYALRHNGLVRWAFRTAGQVSAPLALGRDGTVYAVGGPFLYALRPNGTLKWRRRVGRGPAPPVALSNGRIYVGVPRGLRALSPRGRTIWTYAVGGELSSQVAVSRGVVYAAAEDGTMHAVSAEGERLWTASVGAQPGTPSVGRGGVYVGNGAGRLSALTRDGQRRWSAKLRGVIAGAPAVRGRRVHVGFGDPGLRGGLAAFTTGGRRLWTFRLREEVFSTPAIGGDGTVYFGSGNDRIYALNRRGKPLWSYLTGSAVDSAPAIGPDATLYVSSNDGSLYAFLPRADRGREPPSEDPNRPEPGPLRAPGAVVPLGGGRVAVTDFLRYGVVMLDASGRTVGAFGRRGFMRGDFQVPLDAAAAPDGTIWVADPVANTVQSFVPEDGARTSYSANTWIRPPGRPVAVAAAPGGHRVYVLTLDGTLVAYTPAGEHVAGFRADRGFAGFDVATGPDGDVYAIFQRPSDDAQLSFRFGPDLGERRDIGFANPAGPPYIALDPSHRIYALAQDDRTVTKFEQLPGGFGELAFVLLPDLFHFGLGVDETSRMYVPLFDNSSRPGGHVRVYREERPGEASSPYVLERTMTGAGG